MHYPFKTATLLLVYLLVSSLSFCQQSIPSSPVISGFRGIAQQEGLMFPDYPPLELPGHYLQKQLPVAVDNSVLPYMRPVFTQQGASCGQAAGVAYNFCYEINRARNLSADTSINQYPSHFTWNFMNAGDYYGVGVSYFHSFEILRALGCPNEATFGPITMDNPYVWMSGYEKYLHAMHNRISKVNSIPLATSRGLLTLKNWLNDHLDGSATGGLANIYLGNYPAVQLPTGTPEAGKCVVTEWLFPATHAMTIVGYNDSIRYDVNGDGLFTNDLDINNDGKLDPKDWEIGGVKLVNSYGTNYCNDGYTYALYRSLALDYGMGGIWNNAAHVLTVEPEYQPLLTLRASLTHEKRNSLRVRVGINPDTSATMPSMILGFPVFDNQGGAYYLQGGYDESDKTLELGLDITPLASEFGQDQNARFFLIIDNIEPETIGLGKINEFSVISHNGSAHTYQSGDTPCFITGNGTTMVSVVVHSELPGIQIAPDHLPAMVTGQAYTQQLHALNAQAPFQWELKQDYTSYRLPGSSPIPTGQKIPLPNSEERILPLFLPFSFPFYGESYDTLYIHSDGYLLTGLFNAPYPYLQDEALYLSQVRCIAPFMNQFQEIASQEQGVWISTEPGLVEVTWVLGTEGNSGFNNFKARLFPDGKIEFHYGLMEAGTDAMAAYGISGGDGLNRQLFLHRDRKAGNSLTFTPQNISARLTDDGILTCDTINSEVYGDVEVILTDARQVRKTARYTLSNGPVAELLVQSGNDEFIEAGEETAFTLKVRNTSGEPLENLQFRLGSLSAEASAIDTLETISSLAPGEERIIEQAFRFQVSGSISGTMDLPFRLLLERNGQQREQLLCFTAHRFEYLVTGPVFLDLNDNQPEPGESGEVQLRLTYGPKKPGTSFRARLTTADPYLVLPGEEETSLSGEGSSAYLHAGWDLAILPETPQGHLASLMAKIFDDGQDTIFRELTLLVGKPEVLVIDKDKNNNSAVHIAASIRNLQLLPGQQPVIDSTIFNYRTIFLSMGTKPHMNLLNTTENNLLDVFMEQGGSLYLESGLHFSLQTNFSAIRKFNVQTGYTAWQHKPDTLEGVESVFSGGMAFHYSGDSMNITELTPKEAAFAVFTDKHSGLHFVVANETPGYSTIASSVEFGGIFPFGPTTREKIMEQYLEFLGISPQPLAANFTGSDRKPCVDEWVTFTPRPGGEPLHYQWIFQGGDPAVSYETIGTTRWKTAGKFDISLIVTNSDRSDTLTLSQFVDVQDCSSTQETLMQENYQVYPNPVEGSGVIRIRKSSGKILHIRLQTLQGMTLLDRRLAGEGDAMLQLPHLPSGVYLLNINDQHQSCTEKLIIR